MRSRIIIVADRGTLKAYEFERIQVRGWALRLLEEKIFAEAHQKYRDKFTDQAGAFPAKGIVGHGTSIAEQHGIENEGEARLLKRIGQLITDTLDKYHPTRWLFAAPSEINPGILKHIAPQWRERMMQNIEHDLVKVPAQSILQHIG